jgi:hypothetical protein
MKDVIISEIIFLTNLGNSNIKKESNGCINQKNKEIYK